MLYFKFKRDSDNATPIARIMEGDEMLKRVFIVATILALTGCLAMQKRPSAPDDENLRYMYITVYPDEATIIITVEFKDNTPTFRDTRVTREHEPVAYSIDQRKVKKISLTVQKTGWDTQTRTWENEVPYDVFIKLDARL